MEVCQQAEDSNPYSNVWLIWQKSAEVRRVEIPKPDGGVRLLGMPTVVDQWIQQAIAQEFNKIFAPGFSGSSYGFRPNKSAHQTIIAASGMSRKLLYSWLFCCKHSSCVKPFKRQYTRSYIEKGYRWTVDIDPEKFYDRVNHDKPTLPA